jgi:hypothetical protein
LIYGLVYLISLPSVLQKCLLPLHVKARINLLLKALEICAIKAAVAHAAAVGKRARICETHDYFRVFQLRIFVVLAFGCIT